MPKRRQVAPVELPKLPTKGDRMGCSCGWVGTPQETAPSPYGQGVGGKWYLLHACPECGKHVHEVVPKPPPPRTVPARIAVVVDSRGRYAAHGAAGVDDAELLDIATDDYLAASDSVVTPARRVVYVTVDLPLPDEAPPVEVAGTVDESQLGPLVREPWRGGEP